jgi:hypothetical protein
MLIPALLFSGCATMRPPAATATQDQNRLEQLSEAYNQTLAEGCIVGAGMGAGIGALANSNDRGLGALIGAGVGTLVGCAAGGYMGNLQNSYATQEDRLNAVILDLKRDNQALANMIPVAQSIVADNQRRIKELNDAVANGRSSRTNAAEQMQAIDASRSQLEGALSNAKKRLVDQKQAVAQNSHQVPASQVATANAEIIQKQKQIAALELELNELTKMRSISHVG